MSDNSGQITSLQTLPAGRQVRETFADSALNLLLREKLFRQFECLTGVSYN